MNKLILLCLAIFIALCSAGSSDCTEGSGYFGGGPPVLTVPCHELVICEQKCYYKTTDGRGTYGQGDKEPTSKYYRLAKEITGYVASKGGKASKILGYNRKFSNNQGKSDSFGKYITVNVEIGSDPKNEEAYEYSCIRKDYLANKVGTIGAVANSFVSEITLEEGPTSQKNELKAEFNNDVSAISGFNVWCGANNQGFATNYASYLSTTKRTQNNRRNNLMNSVKTNFRNIYMKKLGKVFEIFAGSEKCQCRTLGYFSTSRGVLHSLAYSPREEIARAEQLNTLCAQEIRNKLGNYAIYIGSIVIDSQETASPVSGGSGASNHRAPLRTQAPVSTTSGNNGRSSIGRRAPRPVRKITIHRKKPVTR